MKRKKKGPADLPPAPGELRLVQAFVNTVDREAKKDELASPRALAEWLARHGLLAPGTELSAADLTRATEVREGWRSVIAGQSNEQVAETLDRATESALLRGRHEPGGRMRLEPAAGGIDGALGRLLLIVSRTQDDGTWERLKVCASSICRVVFYDRSSNRSKRWCRPSCGNRLSSLASKRHSRGIRRREREAKRRAQELAYGHLEELSDAELETHPEFGTMARRLREREERE
ncbi:MAG: CGNR zinc finger domain-containing protein [bacterium]|nr:CGNR zinc finger domain-containing protein [bacterium]